MSSQETTKKLPWGKIVIIAIGVIIIFMMLFVRPFVVPSSSMEPAIKEGDRIVVLQTYGLIANNIDDIIAYQHDDTTFVRRIVACGGDKVEITDGTLFVNGEKSHLQSDGLKSLDGVWELENDEYFVLGDNLGNAEDSRFTGPVKKDEIIGKVVFTF